MVTAMDNAMPAKSKSQLQAGAVYRESLVQEGAAAVARPSVVRWVPMTIS
jgi:hypothetical protein